MAEYLSAIKTIRKHCLDCCNGQYTEVEHCPCTKCVLYPWRMGRDPRLEGRPKKELSDAQKEHIRKMHDLKKAKAKEGKTMP